MDTQKLLIGTLISTVFIFLTDSLWYGMLMADVFPKVEGIDRVVPIWLWLVIGTAILSYAFCAMYVKGYEENKPLVSQGINFGILVSLLAVVSLELIRYSVSTQWSLSNHLTDTVYHVVQMILLGVIIAKFFGPIDVRPGNSNEGGI